MMRRVMEATLVLDNKKIKSLGFSLKYQSMVQGIFDETDEESDLGYFNYGIFITSTNGRISLTESAPCSL